MTDYGTESDEIIQSFYSNWMPYKNQRTTVINTDEIAQKLEAAYGIKSGSIRIRTIVVNSGKTNVNDRRRRKLYRKNHKLPRCDQLGSAGSIVEIAMNIIYPTTCGISQSCKKKFANVVEARIAAHISSILLEFKFADGSYSELELTRCEKATNSSLNPLLRLRRASAATREKFIPAKPTPTQKTYKAYLKKVRISSIRKECGTRACPNANGSGCCPYGWHLVLTCSASKVKEITCNFQLAGNITKTYDPVAKDVYLFTPTQDTIRNCWATVVGGSGTEIVLDYICVPKDNCLTVNGKCTLNTICNYVPSSFTVKCVCKTGFIDTDPKTRLQCADSLCGLTSDVNKFSQTTVKLLNADQYSFNAAGVPVVFKFENLVGNITNYTIFANGIPTADTDNVVDTITVNGFTDNTVILNLLALDTNGLPSFYSFQLYFGSISTPIRVSYANGTLAAGVMVSVNLTSNLLIGKSGLTDTNGMITFNNLPSLTISIFAHSQDNQVAGIGLVPSSSTVSLVLLPFNTQNIAPIGAGEIVNVNTASVQQVQTISRIFLSPPSATEVYVEYQFITLEIPGGYFGSQFNDYFSVVLRSEKGQYAMKTDSMNGLGLGAFVYSTGTTQWYRLNLKVGPVPEQIRLDVNVANVGDSAFNSQVNARFIGAEKCALCEQNCSNCTSEPMCRETCLNPPTSSCLFYRECMETKAKCGLNGYPLEYGLQYCTKFLALSNLFSSSGKTWIMNTTNCLQQALISPLKNCDSCCSLQQIAFNSHPKCYIDNNICNLPAMDWIWIVTIVGKDVLNHNIFIQTLKAQSQCIPTVLATIEAQMASTSGPIKNALAIIHRWLQSL